MKASVKTLKSSSSKHTSKKRVATVLEACPTSGAGWCPYPFSWEQLQRKMKTKIMQQDQALAKTKRVHVTV